MEVQIITPLKKKMSTSPNTRLKQFIESIDDSYEDLARKTGLARRTWQRQVEEGASIKSDYLLKLREIYGADIAYILTGDKYQNEELPPHRVNETGEPWNPDDFVVVPFYYKVYASAGHGRVNESEEFVDVAFRKRFFNSTVHTDWRNCFMIRMKGDSMHPLFPDGAELLIDENRKQIKDGPGYVITIEDEVYCKLIRKRPDGKIELHSLNEFYKPMTIDPKEEGFHIVGQVIWHAQTSKYI